MYAYCLHDLRIAYKGVDVLILCFGILGRVLREVKNKSVSDIALIGALTKTVDPNCEYGESEGTAVSRLLSCDQELSNGQSRRKGQKSQTELSDFESGYGTNRLSAVKDAALTANRGDVASKIMETVFPLLDADRRKLIFPALYQLIAEDKTIDEEREASFTQYVGIKKDSLLLQREVVLPDFLAGLLLYVIIAVPNKHGKEYAKMIDRSFVDQFRNSIPLYDVKFETKGTAHGFVVADCPESFIKQYLENIKNKYGSVRTILTPYQQTALEKIYVCNDIIRRIPVQSRLYYNAYREEYLKNVTAKELAACSNFVIIVGTGGIGKSMMLRHLLLDSIENYTANGIVPIFVMLKDFDVNCSSLFDYLYLKIEKYGTGITKLHLHSWLESGKCLILLDGLDEIVTKNAAAFEQKLEAFTDRYPNNQYVISSRPHRIYSAYPRFTSLQIRPLTKEQALVLVGKLECSEADYEIKEEFCRQLKATLYNSHRQFAENPLLLTIMYMTFELFRDVPSKMHLFYRDAYNALSQSHDALKGLKRPSQTGLTADEFSDWFSEFCARTYSDEKYELTESEFSYYFKSLSLHKKYPERIINKQAFRDDLCDNLCLMYYESGAYHFTHRSFQEYFCALFFSKQKDRTLENIGSFFDNLRSRSYGDKTFSMLYDMIPEKIEEYVFIPYLKRLFEECDSQKGYWTFLEMMYPQIEFTFGDTEVEAEVAPSSFIYEFIRLSYLDAEYDFESLPKDNSFIHERYVRVYDSDSDDETLMEIGEVPSGDYDVSEEVGWLYVIDIGKLLEKNYLAQNKAMIAAMEAEDFSLKKEYNAAKECYQRLLDKQKPKGASFFDLFN